MRHDAAKWVPLFPEGEVPFILAAILRSGVRLKKLHGTELENDLSDRLRNLLDRDSGLRVRPIELFREVPLYDRKRVRQRQLGRPDLMFLYSTGREKPWPSFVIESKRLHVTFASGWKSLVSDYVTGRQGMMCFIEDRYARGLESGAMLGYVFDGQIARARSSIAESIGSNHGQLKCSRSPGFRPSSVLKDDLRVSESSHSLSFREFKIYHLVLAV
ncbi:MAG: hypothetical protein ABSG79_23495 [Bryobacteraceae bacterium]|jgi:hypothetical protein